MGQHARVYRVGSWQARRTRPPLVPKEDGDAAAANFEGGREGAEESRRQGPAR